jgi:putative ABC transport system permease protein
MTNGLFRRLSFRRLRQHKLRGTLTILGVSLGVSAMVSIGLLHDSLSKSYQETIDKMAGRAALQLTNGEAGVPEELVDAAKTVAGVQIAAPSVQGFLPLADGGGQVYVFGIDLLGDDGLYGGNKPEIDDPIVFIAKADSVGLTTSFLQETGRQVGDKIRVRSPSGVKELTIRAEVDGKKGMGAVFGGRLALMDFNAAQRLFALDRRLTQIDVVVTEGTPVPVVQAGLEQLVAGRALVERPKQRGEVLDRLITTNRYTLTLGAAIAIVIGLYLIFNMMMIGISERRRDFALLRMIGVERNDVLRLVALEGLLIGALGSALGVPLSIWVAKSGAADFAASISTRFVHVDAPQVSVDLSTVLLGVVAGCVSALIAAIVPAAAAAHVHPLESLRTSAAPGAAARRERSLVPGVSVIAVSLVVWWLRTLLPLDPNVSGATATVGLLVGLSLVAPPCVSWLAKRTEGPFSGAFGLVGMMASRSIVTNISRVARTCSTFLVSLAGALAMAAMIWSLMQTLGLWVDDVFGDMDLMVASGDGKISLDSMPFPEAVADGIRELPGVRGVEAIRFAKVAYRDSVVVVAATDPRSPGRKGGVRIVEGNQKSALDRVERGEAVIVNEPLARNHQKTVGDTLALSSPQGPVDLPIAGVYFDMQDLGKVRMDRGLYKKLWRDGTISTLSIGLEPGADRAKVIDEIRRRWGDTFGLFVLTTDEFRSEFQKILSQSMAGAYSLIAIAIGIALLGLVNALAASVLDRTREFGLLRIIGATRRQVVRLVVIEATIIGLMAGVLGVVGGSLLGRLQVDVIVGGMCAMTVLYSFPAKATVFGLIASVLLAAAAGYLPGRRAARPKIVDALGCE